MKLTQKIKVALLLAVIFATPLLLIGLINSFYYTVEFKECRASEENKLNCHIGRICLKEWTEYDECYNYLKQSISDITARALTNNDSTICKEAKKELQFICYYEFAKKLEFTLTEVFIYNMEGDGLNLCNSLSGQLQKKCFFNLALETKNVTLCSKTQELSQRCTESISLIWNNIGSEDLYVIVRSRMNDNPKRPHVKFSFLLDGQEGFAVENGWLRLYNDNDKNLDGEDFYLFKNLRLVDADGCENSLISPHQACVLEFNKFTEWEVLEVLYGGRTAYIDPGCDSRSCRQEYGLIPSE